jgi:hypothetical protein
MIGVAVAATTVGAIVRRAIARTAPVPEVEPTFTFTPAGAAPT